MDLLYFFDIRFAASFFLFLTFAIFGTLQFLAARHRLIGFSLFGHIDTPQWNYFVGVIVTAGAFVWFYSTHWSQILRPGPAGAELTLLFGFAGLLALSITFTLNSLLRWLRSQNTGLSLPDSVNAREVELREATGTLILPSQGGPHPAIAALCDPSISAYSIEGVVSHLGRNGFGVLLIHLPAGNALDHLESFTLLPTACSYLTEHPEINENRIATLGFGRGGDLALRAASSDEQVTAAVALTPLLDFAVSNPGLELLQEMSYLEALKWSWSHAKDNSGSSTESAEGEWSSAQCPTLLVYGEDDGLIPLADVRRYFNQVPQAQLRTIGGAGHFSLSQSVEARRVVVTWLEEHL